jgi:pimeloyl-ACP methyl ester carboxylesterase
VIGTLAALASLALAAPAPQAVRFKTADGWSIAALYAPPQKGKPVAVLVHGVAAGKGEWWKLSQALEKEGFGTLALDLRGHGESVNKGTFQDFDRKEEWPRAAADIEAALAFLKKKGFAPARVGLAGGSIGANLVSQFRQARWLILLSPGENYRGVGVGELSGKKAVVAASPGDAYAFQTASSLALRPNGPVFLQAAKGHGAQLLDDPEFLAKLVDWIKKN